MAAQAIVTGTAGVNGAELYYEVRGAGPAVLLIHGIPLDAGCYDALAGILAKEFTVITYDGRGHSRSPRPAGWNQTSIEEQADDADALLTTLAAAPAMVFGASSAGLVALDLTLRHADHVRGVILHEPSTYTVLPAPYVQEQFAAITPLIERAVANGGPRAGQQTLLAALAGERGFESLATAESRERWLTNAALIFEMEFPMMLLAYHPDPAAIAAIGVPVLVLRAEESLPINIAAAEWLATQTRNPLLECPGTHLAYCQEPHEVAASITPFLTRVSRGPATVVP